MFSNDVHLILLKISNDLYSLTPNQALQVLIK